MTHHVFIQCQGRTHSRRRWIDDVTLDGKVNYGWGLLAVSFLTLCEWVSSYWPVLLAHLSTPNHATPTFISFTSLTMLT